MKRRVIRAGAAGCTRSRRRTGRPVLLVAAVLLASALLVLVYGTGTLSWEEIFSFVGLHPGTAQTQTGAEPDETAAAAEPLAPDEAAVTVLDVGQGDAILIETPKETVLIDGGDAYAADTLCGALRARGIERLDYVFLTHPHRDHFGGLTAVFRQFEIGRLYMTSWPPDETPTNTAFLEFMQAAADCGLDVWIASPGDQIALDLGTLTVLFAGGFSELNDCSIVLDYTYGETAFLFMGDAGFQVENRLLEDGLPGEYSLLKAGHHGSRYSTGEAFIERVSPAYVAVSCGRDNQYGYPTQEFVERVEAVGAQLLRTDLDGSLRFISDGVSLRAETQKQDEEAA